MTTALVFLALCLLWGLPIVVSFCLCHAAKREPVEFGGDQKAGLTPSKSINRHARSGLRGADHKFGVGAGEAESPKRTLRVNAPFPSSGAVCGKSVVSPTAHTLTLSSPQEL